MNENETNKRYIVTLSIAGSDSSGGAGIQADIKTMSALGCFAATAITSITVQNTLGVTDIQDIEPRIVAGQIRAVMNDIHPAAIKIGMVSDSRTICAIAETLHSYDNLPPIIIDPVMVSTSGSRLMQQDAIETFKKELMPMATLLTPNIAEAEVLSGCNIKNIDSIDKAAQLILSQNCNTVLIKGGHLEEKTDRLYARTGHDAASLIASYHHDNINSANTHGTGCTLSSAIVAFMARGEKLEDAIRLAKEYVSKAIASGAEINIGRGAGPVNHFFNPQKMIVR